ncbi:LOW QUALITY PROTEIN: solute carrier family 7 member 13 [Dromiciops gliroides]|uniref:LOW QUALITY PROTEIN: solute carrier family 7 member 13 n=1 Tax=Dromiciops gliroides TaxID=33562 RepID=UPI001CC7B661|nr:LOW QUALITY PROTEIN: solute carrier family 7 member 13 [Dromiciops gliroides]
MDKMNKTQLQRAIGYFHGVTFLLSSIIGAGIFIAPKGVLKYSSLNVGITLSIWVACAVVSMTAALTYAEVGTTFPQSGAQYYFLKRSLGSPFFFFCLWIHFFTTPAEIAGRTLLLAEYAIQPFYPGCFAPALPKKCLALAILWSLGIFSVQGVNKITWFQTISTMMKTSVLCLIALSGAMLLVIRKENLIRLGSTFSSDLPNISQIPEAFFQGLYAYSGWHSLVSIAGEVKNPEKNIPRCIFTALFLVTILYLLVNIAYLTVLTPEEIIASDAVAMTWIDRVIPSCQWIISIGVSTSILSGLLSTTFSSSRLYYCASQEGQIPLLFSMLNNHSSPALPVIQTIIFASVMIIPSDIIRLINLIGFVVSIENVLIITGLIKLRYQKPNLPRPFKVHLSLAFGTVIMFLLLVLIPIIQSPKMHHIYIFFFILMGFLLYLGFVHYKLHFGWFDEVTCYLQLLLNISPPEGPEEYMSKEITLPKKYSEVSTKI